MHCSGVEWSGMQWDKVEWSIGSALQWSEVLKCSGMQWRVVECVVEWLGMAS